MTVQIFIRYLLDDAIYRHQLMSLNMRRCIRIQIFVQVNISKKRSRVRFHKKKKIRLYIVLGAPTLCYKQGNDNSCIISSLASALHFMSDEYASKNIIRRKQKYLLEIHNKGRMHFFRDILTGHHREKRKKTKLSYWGMTFIHVIWYILGSVYLSNSVFVTRNVAPDQSLYYSLR